MASPLGFGELVSAGGTGGGKTRIAQASLGSMRGRGGSGHGNKEPRDLVRVLLAV